MVVYLSGPMTGIEDLNKPAFDMFAATLRQEGGYTVINPAETAGGDLAAQTDRAWCFRYDFAVLSTCDAVFCMPGWHKSQGAMAEVMVANEMGIPVYALTSEGQCGRRIEVRSMSLLWELERSTP